MDMNRNKNYDFGRIVFFAIFVLWFTIEYVYGINVFKFSWGTNAAYLRVMSPVKYIFVLYIATCKKYDLKTWFVIIAVSALLFVSARISHFYDIFYAWLFLVAAKGEDSEKLIKLSAVLLTIYLMATVSLAAFGVLDNVTFSRANEVVRYSYGFQHPNQLGFRLFILLACILYICRDRLHIWHFVATAVVAAVSWIILNSRAQIICIFLAAVLAALKKPFDRLALKKQIWILRGMLVLSVCAAFIMLAETFLFEDAGLMHLANKALSNRFGFSRAAYDEWGAKMLGQRIFITMSERASIGLAGEIIVDSAFVNILLRAGIAVTALFILGYNLSLSVHMKRFEYSKCAVMMIMSVYGMIELMPYMPMWNVFLLFVSDAVPNHSSDKTVFHTLKDLFTKKSEKETGENEV